MGRWKPDGKAHRYFVIPLELDEWLTEIARPDPDFPYLASKDMSKNAIVTRGLYLVRELLSGIPSPASTELLDMALAKLEPPKKNRERKR